METKAFLDNFVDQVAKMLNDSMDDEEPDKTNGDDEAIPSGNVALKKSDAQPVDVDDMEYICAENHYINKPINVTVDVYPHK
ncbi:hypothetical protein ACA910_004324 [Epithemia clementina (nom. ined.)]